MLYLYTVILIILAIMVFFIFKDALSPAFLFCLPWILSFIGLSFSKYTYSTDSLVYSYIVLGAFTFILGFGMFLGKVDLKKRYTSYNKKFMFNKWSFRILILCESLITLYLVFKHIIYVRSHFVVSIYQSIRQGLANGTLVLPEYLIYARSIIIVLSACIVVIYFNIDEKQKKSFRKIMYIQLLLAIVNLTTTMTRNGILISALPILIAILICKNFSNRKIFKYGGIFSIVFLVFFSVIAVMKVSYISKYDSNLQLLTNQFSLYMSGSLVALERFLETNSEYAYGQNTFRIFSAIFNRIYGDGEVQQLVQNTISIDGHQGTNVYTFYQYYAKDFGMVYALVIQFVVGMLHAFLYKMMLSKEPIKIYLFSIMIYPLIMQFFQDQYFSLASTWVQYFIIGLIFFKSSIFLKRNIIKEHSLGINRFNIRMSKTNGRNNEYI
ncbi:O-antigen polymerase [Priestia megaterium]|uniref:O-antigen polymerase n=1 Tax=Priestia megaterium TaxID=1404 RepID=UPI003A80662B